MTHYYNENDIQAAQWLRELIAAGQIPDGVVDERSILDVQPADVAGFVQCHFFAGIGGWSLAIKLAGWPIDKPVWTGSCPCQPFSCAGKGKGDADKRHLWPEFARLIKSCQPATVFGEQVASKLGREWLSGVFADLEAMGYSRAGADLCAAGVGAPHIRQRLYWVGHAQGIGRIRRQDDEDSRRRELTSGHSGAGDSGLALAQSEQPHGGRDAGGGRGEPSDGSNNGGLANAPSPRCVGPLRDAESQARDEARMLVSGEHGEDGGMDNTGNGAEHGQLPSKPGSDGPHHGLSRPSSHWDDYELIPCADGKARRIGKRILWMVDGLSGIMANSGECRGGENETAKEEVDAKADASRSNPVLRRVSGEAGEETIPELTGGSGPFCEKEVLQPELHGAGIRRSHQEAERHGEPEAGSKTQEELLRTVRQTGETSPASSGREPDEQRRVQSGDIVRLLSSILALGTWQEEIQAGCTMQVLRYAFEKAGILPEALSEIPQIWRSASDQARQCVGRVLCAGAEWRVIPVLTSNDPGRVMKLRGYGNAINPVVAAQFIRAVMELERR